MTTEMMNRMELNNNEQEMVNGGELRRCPDNYTLKQLELDGLVQYDGGWTDKYYKTNRGNGEWKTVGSEDMLRYVERTIGSDDERYQALATYCHGAMAAYKFDWVR